MSPIVSNSFDEVVVCNDHSVSSQNEAGSLAKGIASSIKCGNDSNGPVIVAENPVRTGKGR